MKYVLSGVALAALIAAGLPASAQNSTTRSTTPMPPATTAAPAGTAGQSSAMPSGGQSMDNQSSGQSSGMSSGSSAAGNARSGRHGRSPQDNMAEQLNHEELQRVTNGDGGQAGSTMPPAGSMQNGATMQSGTSGPANARPRSGLAPSNMTPSK